MDLTLVLKNNNEYFEVGNVVKVELKYCTTFRPIVGKIIKFIKDDLKITTYNGDEVDICNWSMQIDCSTNFNSVVEDVKLDMIKRIEKIT